MSDGVESKKHPREDQQPLNLWEGDDDHAKRRRLEHDSYVNAPASNHVLHATGSVPQPSPSTHSGAGRKLPITREQQRYCGTIVKDLKRHRDAGPFLAPVDPVLLNIPDYPSIIKNPMDLSTVERKLNNVEYETVDDFTSDMDLIFTNCYLYNGSEAPVSKCAANLQNAFNKLLRRMPKEQGSKVVAEPAPAKEISKKASAPKPKKEPKKEEPKLIPLQLVTPSSTALTGMFAELVREPSEERRPKRDIQVPSKDIQTGVSSKRKGSERWKTDPQLRHCHTIIRDLSKKSNFEFMFPFMEPVDWVKLQIPEYPKIIKHPMDIGTIRSKLEKDEYDNAAQFEADVRLVIRNCYTFNPAGTPVHDMGSRMEKFFNAKWDLLPRPPTPPPVEEVDVDSEEESSGESDSADDKIADLERHLKTLSEQLASMRTKQKEKSDRKSVPKTVPEKPAPKTIPERPAPERAERAVPEKGLPEKPKSKATSSSSKELARAAEKKRLKKRSEPRYSSSEDDDEDDDVPRITFEQKKELSERINDFEGDQLATVVQIIHDSMPSLRESGGQEEIELDMDSLDPKTLYRLYQYVRSSSKQKQQPPPKKVRQYSQEDASKKITELEQTLQKLPRAPHSNEVFHDAASSSSSESGSDSDSGSGSESAPF
ncbi:Bromodomain-containing protein [Mortierella sp. GBAus27b]|nr:Bromodomain-containing protein [Mortierella sp. GBAus27b]